MTVWLAVETSRTWRTLLVVGSHKKRLEEFNMDERIKKILMEDCEMSETDIAVISKREALEAILNYEGITGYTEWIINLIQDIYGVTLK